MAVLWGVQPKVVWWWINCQVFQTVCFIYFLQYEYDKISPTQQSWVQYLVSVWDNDRHSVVIFPI